MKVIKEGDLYFLESPFHINPPNEESVYQEKKLSYLLGTVSSRPAVVVRAPAFWDRFNTVTVIPALSHGDPAVTFHLLDRYGRLTEADYPFVPHNPHTIPVARLGKYIGSLEPEEIRELLYAFHWIHDAEMQANRDTYQVPPVYRKVMMQKIPAMSWKHNRDSRANVDIGIDADTMEIASETHPELNGFPIGQAQMTVEVSGLGSPEDEFDELDRSIENDATKCLAKEEDAKILDVLNEFTSTTEFRATENVLPDSEGEEPGVPVERSYPPSMFSRDMLDRVASRFTISDAYYNNTVTKRDRRILTEDDVRSIRNGLSNTDMNQIYEIYDQMSAMDAIILGPRLPLAALTQITGLTNAQATVMKRMCNFLRDLSDTEYDERLGSVSTENPKTEEVRVPTPLQNQKRSRQELKDMCERVRPYMNIKSIRSMPEDVALDFMELSMGSLKRLWSGPNFKAQYQRAREYYKNKFALMDLLYGDQSDDDK